MIKINDIITKILDQENMSTILCFIDYNETFDDEKFLVYLQTIIDYSPILKKFIENKNNNYYWVENLNFNIKEQYVIKNEQIEMFDTNTEYILNQSFLTKTKWYVTVLNDTIQNKSRIYLKINHAYCDGYKLIDILFKPFDKLYSQPIFKRSKSNIIDTIYYCIIGTISLMIIYISTLYSIYTTPKSGIINTYPVININCGVIKLKRIKKIAKKYDVSINSILYTLMAKTWFKYNQTTDVIITSPIYIKKTATNNVFLLFNKIYNENMLTILKKTDELFNKYKYSPFILCANEIMNYLLSFSWLTTFLHTKINNSIFEVPITFSNIIGPPLYNYKYKVTNLQFSIIPKNNMTAINFISFRNKININVSCRETVISDKARFLQCYKESLCELMSLK